MTRVHGFRVPMNGARGPVEKAQGENGRGRVEGVGVKGSGHVGV